MEGEGAGHGGEGAGVELGDKNSLLGWASAIPPPPPPPLLFFSFFSCLCVCSVLGVSVVADEDISR